MPWWLYIVAAVLVGIVAAALHYWTVYEENRQWQSWRQSTLPWPWDTIVGLISLLLAFASLGLFFAGLYWYDEAHPDPNVEKAP